MQSAGGDDDDDHDLVTAWGLVLEATSRVGREMARELEEAVGLNATWAEVLFRLRRTPQQFLPTTLLAREVSFSSGGFTKLLDHLVAAGLVERLPCPTDRRVTYAALTPLGREKADAALAVHARSLRRHVLAVLGPDRLSNLAQTMRLLRSDTALPRSDAALPRQDTARPRSDTARPRSDAARPRSDAAPPRSDGGRPRQDGAPAPRGLA